MQEFKLSPEESAIYHDDESRGSIRSRLSAQYPEGVHVLNNAGDLLDVLGAIEEPTQASFQPEMTDLQREIGEVEAAQKAFLLKHESEPVEAEVPITNKEDSHLENFRSVVAQVTESVKADFQAKLQEKSDLIAKLRASLKSAEDVGSKLRVKMIQRQAEIVDMRTTLAEAKIDLEQTQNRLLQLQSTMQQSGSPITHEEQLSQLQTAWDTSNRQRAGDQSQIETVSDFPHSNPEEIESEDKPQ